MQKPVQSWTQHEKPMAGWSAFVAFAGKKNAFMVVDCQVKAPLSVFLAKQSASHLLRFHAKRYDHLTQSSPTGRLPKKPHRNIESGQYPSTFTAIKDLYGLKRLRKKIYSAKIAEGCSNEKTRSP